MTTKPYSVFGAFDPPCNYCGDSGHGVHKCPYTKHKRMKEPTMKTIEHRLGFTVSYLNKNGTVGFIGIDDASGGYPYFSDGLTPRRIVSAGEAIKQLAGLSKEMKGYYGSDKVQLDTMQVVEVVVKTADPVFVDKIVQQELLAKANKTFSADEIAMLKEVWGKK